MKPNDEIVYSLIVPNLTSAVDRDNAQRELDNHGVPANLRKTDSTTISVPRLYTRWRGDTEEQTWQQTIKAALPSAIIDVQPWSHAPGYPKGEIDEPSSSK